MNLPESRYPTSRLKSDHLEQVFAEVILGRPTAGCRHFGVCEMVAVSFETLSASRPKACRASAGVYALASLQAGKRFELAFLRSSIQPDVFLTHFGDGIFRIEEPYTAGPNFMSSPIQLVTGQYRIENLGSLLRVQFELRASST